MDREFTITAGLVNLFMPNDILAPRLYYGVEKKDISSDRKREFGLRRWFRRLSRVFVIYL